MRVKEAALRAIVNSRQDMLSPADVAPIIGCSPYTISLYARRHPRALGFPVLVSGIRVQIPRDGFLAWWTGLPREAARR